MRIKTLYIILTISFYSIITSPQGIPVSYDLRTGHKLAKINTDDTPGSNDVSEIIVVGDTVIVATSDGISITTDKGNSWNNYYNKDIFSDNNIFALGYNNGVIWVSLGIRFNDNDLGTIDEGKGLAYSSDLGKNWTSVPQPLDTDADSIIVYGINHIRALPVTVPQQNITFDISFTTGTVWITSFSGGLRKSTDNGKTWQRIVLPPDYLDHIAPTDTLNFCLSPSKGKFCSEGNLNQGAFSVLAINDTTLYVGTAGGINKSTDGGISWTKFNHTNQSNPISANWATYLDYNPVTKTLWASTWKTEGSTEFYGVSETSDGGNSWKTFLPSVKTINFGFKGSDVIATSTEGVFRTNNSGISWILPTSIIDSDSKISLQTNVFFDAGSDGQDIWLASGDGLVKFTETGGMWNGKWKIYNASKSLTSTTESYAYPNPFIPKQGALKIKYSTGGKVLPVTIRIFDFGMNYVKTIIQNVQKGGSVTSSTNLSEIDFWDGKDDSGRLVSNGVYFYRIDRGDEQPLFGKILVIQ